MQDKHKLKDKIESRIRTTMIGAIAAIEEEFGFLFGHGKSSLTKEERELDNYFRAVRKKILDLGNDQIKRLEDDLEGYDIDGPKYHTEFSSINQEEFLKRVNIKRN